MTIAELINIVGFVVVLVAIGISYGALKEQVKQLCKRQDNEESDAKEVAKDFAKWQKEEPARIRELREREVLSVCGKQFSSIQESLSILKGQMTTLINQRK